jgi:hypothetical protein
MKALIPVALTLVFCPPVLPARQVDHPVHVSSVAPAGARFEVVQSAISARGTYRVDKFTGSVDVLAMRPDSSIVWQPIPRLQHSQEDTRPPGQANYQLFLSGIAMRFSVLVNVNTGATWQLVKAKDDSLLFEPIS